MNERKSTQEYWDENWRVAGDGLKPAEEKNFFWKRLDVAFKIVFSIRDHKDSTLIEIGAGASEWLPRLNQEYLFKVSGLDYSQEGCERARSILEQAGVNGNVYLGDMFSPPDDLLGKYDVACSFGLVEHFTNTAEAVRACANFVTSGGIVLTLIPNMTGLNGFLYKVLNRRVFDTHVPLTLDQLVQAHIDAGLEPYFSCYLLSLPGVIDVNRYEPVLLRRWLRKTAHYISRFVWWLEARGIGVPENGVTSPYMLCAAKVNGIISK